MEAAHATPQVRYSKFASVILELSLDKTLDYGISEELLPYVKRGMQVEVPVRGKMRPAIVFALKDQPEIDKVLPIHRILSQETQINEELFELALWMARYYCSPLSLVLRTMLPSCVRRQTKAKTQALVKATCQGEPLRLLCEELRGSHPAQAIVLELLLQAPKGLFLSEILEETGLSKSPISTLEKKGILRLEKVGGSSIAEEEYFATSVKELNEEQKNALSKILMSLEAKRFEVHLLHGVTGSGKTEIYLQAIQKALDLGKGCLMLVPEISLTTQTIERFKSRFQQRIALLHHRLSEGERAFEWEKIKQGKAPVVVGARSAVFSPIPNLGLVIVDEEHEHSYKQGEKQPCYHARDVAIMRAYHTASAVILGSATPSLESIFNVENKKYTLSILSTRAGQAEPPKITLVDMKRECDKAGGFTLFSQTLLEAIKERHAVGEQTILFLNRRGYHTSRLCKGCGHVIKCSHCDLSLTFHIQQNKLACHLCGYQVLVPNCCPSCKSADGLIFKGLGTQAVEKALGAVLPNIRALRVDADTTRHKGSHEKLLRTFRTGKADVLIGTQMVSKGLHFPSVTLVGVLNCDLSLQIPDFRSSEVTFQLLVQVAGRAGRGRLAGEVILQSFQPQDPLIELATKQDFSAFYKEELSQRKMFGFPPFSHLIKLTFTGKDEAETKALAKAFCLRLVPKCEPPFFVHDVQPCGYAKIKDHFRFQLLMRGPSVYFLNQQLQEVMKEVAVPSHFSLMIDVDPTSIFF